MPVINGVSSPAVATTNSLVDQPQPVLDTPLLDQRAALLVAGQPDEVGVTEALADRSGFGGGGVPRLPVAGAHLPQPDRDQQPAALDAVAPVALELPLRASKPSSGAGVLAAEQHVVSDPERTPHGAQRLAGFQVPVMSPLQRPDILLIPTAHVGRSREQLQVRRVQTLRVVSGCQRLMSLDPRALGIRLATPLQLGKRPTHGESLSPAPALCASEPREGRTASSSSVKSSRSTRLCL